MTEIMVLQPMVEMKDLMQRRSFLKGTGAALATGIVASASATAEDDVSTNDYFGHGQDVITTNAAYVYPEPTTSSQYKDIVYEDTEGQCLEDQVENDGNTWVKVGWVDGTESGYVTTDVLEHTNQVNQ